MVVGEVTDGFQYIHIVKPLTHLSIGGELDDAQYLYQLLNTTDATVVSSMYRDYVLEVMLRGSQKAYLDNKSVVHRPEVYLRHKSEFTFDRKCWLTLHIFKDGTELPQRDSATCSGTIKALLQRGKDITDKLIDSNKG